MQREERQSTTQVILGIDPGLANTGWGIIRRKGSAYRCLAYGCITTTNDDPIAERLKQIHDELAQVIARFQPGALGIESIYFGANTKSAFATGQARGVALLACAEAGIKVGEYTPMQIKQAVVGTGTADKSQVQYMVQALLNLDHVPKPDHSSDALAAAICFGNLEPLADMSESRRAIRGDAKNASWEKFVKERLAKQESTR